MLWINIPAQWTGGQPQISHTGASSEKRRRFQEKRTQTKPISFAPLLHPLTCLPSNSSITGKKSVCV